MTNLPLSKVDIAIAKPPPALPNKFPLGILQLSKVTVAVDDALIPSLSSFFPMDTPGCFISTMKQLIPLCFNALSVVANTIPKSAS